MKNGVPQSPEVRIPVRHESDVPMVRKHVRTIARDVGLLASAVESLATALSEIARNIVIHGGGGEIVIHSGNVNNRRGVVAVATDAGPGIADIDRAMQDGYSTGAGLGLGLPSARRLADEFDIVSVAGAGTVVRLAMWVREGVHT